MTEQERSELNLDEQDLELDLDDIMKEFAAEEDRPVQETSAQALLEAALSEAGVRLDGQDDTVPFVPVAASADTVAFSAQEVSADTAVFSPVAADSDTVAFTPVEAGPEEEVLGEV